jgi:1-deoxyxylulose-5-phosphate synthase
VSIVRFRVPGRDPLSDDMYDEADFDVVDVVRAVADERGLPPAPYRPHPVIGHS